MEFKGTKGRLEKKYISGICIGIGTFGEYSEMTANSIIPDTDNEKELEILEADMLLYSKAPEMLKMLQDIHTGRKEGRLNAYVTLNEIKELIKSATTLKEE